MDEPVSRRVAVEFESEGAILRGFLYQASKGEPPFPMVVMTHGTSGTIPMVADRYAEVFAEAGVSALLYDHRNLGISGGEPRQEINPWVQARGYRDAITFAATLDDHDPTRIGVWGDSYSAGQVFLVAACDARIKVIVAQCPVFGAEPPGVDPTREAFELIRETFESGDVSGAPGDKTGPMPVVSADQLGTPSLLAPIQAYRWFVDYGGRHGSGWQNLVTRIVPSGTAPFSPYLCAPFVSAPSLMMVAPADEMVHANPAVSRRAFDLLPGEKEWYDLDGGHFGLLYHPSDLFDEASRVQADYIAKHLLLR
ncbi:MAG: acetylxylan esterase [Acidimicrobiia bacterium]